MPCLIVPHQYSEVKMNRREAEGREADMVVEILPAPDGVQLSGIRAVGRKRIRTLDVVLIVMMRSDSLAESTASRPRFGICVDGVDARVPA